jgi:hypothetical protein
MGNLEDCITGGNGTQDGCYKQVALVEKGGQSFQQL